jgi:tetrahydromethanopterin S-methyltransferase subunit B
MVRVHDSNLLLSLAVPVKVALEVNGDVVLLLVSIFEVIDGVNVIANDLYESISFCYDPKKCGCEFKVS